MKNKKYILSIFILLAAVKIPTLLGLKFSAFPDDLPPQYFNFIQYALECIFLFVAIIVSILLVIKATK